MPCKIGLKAFITLFLAFTSAGTTTLTSNTTKLNSDPELRLNSAGVKQLSADLIPTLGKLGCKNHVYM